MEAVERLVEHAHRGEEDITSFIGLLAGKSKKVATLKEINEIGGGDDDDKEKT